MNKGSCIRKTAMMSIVAMSIAIFSGCSAKNPFGIGYDTSVCESSKKYGVCGSPRDILKYKNKINDVQKKYLYSGLKKRLYFAVDPNGNILVKSERDGKWQFYASSKWKKIVDEKYRQNIRKLREASSESVTTRKARVSYGNDIPVTEENDLSIKYSEQGKMLSTRTSVGDIIRDAGRVQKIFIANYVDPQGDLVASHEVYVVVKDPQWIVGEKTPKKSYYEDREIPTPLSKDLLRRQTRTSEYQEDVIRAYNNDSTEGVMKAVSKDPERINREESKDMEIIKKFINNKGE